MMIKEKSLAKGFTVVEIAVVVPIIIVIALAMFEILFTLVQTNDAERTKTFLVYEREQALNVIEPDILLTASFLTQTDANVSDSYAPSGGWQYTTGNTSGDVPIRTLLLRTYSTSANPLADSREPIYVGAVGSPLCDPNIKATNPVLTYNTIYFVDTNTHTLYRRRLIDSTTPTCGDTQYQQQSCPLANSSSICPADEVIANDVTGFAIDYYTELSDPAALNVYNGGPGVQSQILSATGIQLTLELSRVASGQPVTTQTTIKLARLNNGSSGY